MNLSFKLFLKINSNELLRSSYESSVDLSKIRRDVLEETLDQNYLLEAELIISDYTQQAKKRVFHAIYYERKLLGYVQRMLAAEEKAVEKVDPDSLDDVLWLSGFLGQSSEYYLQNLWGLSRDEFKAIAESTTE